MYCSSCGAEVTQELNYCNRCGAYLNPPLNLVPQMPPAPVRLTGPSIALAMMVVFSLAAIFSSARDMVLRGVHPAALTFIVIVSLAVVFGVAGLFIRLWSSVLTNRLTQNPQPPSQLKRAQANPPLPAAQTGRMNEPVSSVTDHTTRTFEPAYRERFEKGK